MPDRRAAGPTRGAIIMLESVEQMHTRLCSVIAAARFEALSQPYAWEQVSEPLRVSTNALAVVRDGSAWYALASWYFILQRLERFGLRCVARWNHEERGGNWCPGGVRLRRARDAGTVANLTGSVRLLGGSMGSGGWSGCAGGPAAARGGAPSGGSEPCGPPRRP